PRQNWQKDQQWLKSTLIPVFMATVRKASAVAVAMEARGFQPGQMRTSWTELQFDRKDWFILVLAILYGAGSFIILMK
ncbi:MAG TPA: energy-coupling factor transporter transmembrane protein EcfT, partial [Bacillota bacterium]|nr:energy-coupling factor transporter transmembrane protein EcfT [Bacillota bacterium]